MGAGDANIVFARDNIGHDPLGIILDNVLVETSETPNLIGQDNFSERAVAFQAPFAP